MEKSTGTNLTVKASQIAIECTDLWKDNQGRLFGKMWLLVDGMKIGNSDSYVLMDGVLLWLTEFVNFQGRRFHEDLNGLNDKDCLRTVMLTLYDDGETNQHLYEEGVYDWEKAKLFKQLEFCPKVSPSFDGEKAVLVDYEGYSKFIFQPFESSDVYSVMLNNGELTDIIVRLIDGISSIKEV